MTIIPDCFVKIKGQDNQIQISFPAISFSNCKEFELNSLQLQYVNLGGLNFYIAFPYSNILVNYSPFLWFARVDSSMRGTKLFSDP